VGPASQALSLPWFATDLGAGVAEMVDAEEEKSPRLFVFLTFTHCSPHSAACAAIRHLPNERW